MSKVKDLTDCRGSRTRPQEVRRARELLHHAGIQVGLAASQTDIGLDSDQGHVVTLPDASLDLASAIEITAASGANPGSLF